PGPGGRLVPFIGRSDAVCKRELYQLKAGKIGGWSSENQGQAGPVQWNFSPSGLPYFGPFAQQSLTLKLTKLPPHRHVRLDMDALIIGSWDGNGRFGRGPDILDIRVPGVGTALHSSFFNNTEGSGAHQQIQSFPQPFGMGFNEGYTGAAETRTLGFVEPWAGEDFHRDATYRLNYTFEHTGPTLELVITGQTVRQDGINTLWGDELWGLGSMTVKTD
ncbi:MAG: hypothetical protein ABUL49_00905, partial [bacterium]